MWLLRLSLLLCIVVFLIEVRLTNAHDAINHRHGRVFDHITNKDIPRKRQLFPTHHSHNNDHHHGNEVDDTKGHHDHQTQKKDAKPGRQFVGPKHSRAKINRHGRRENRPIGRKGQRRHGRKGLRQRHGRKQNRHHNLRNERRHHGRKGSKRHGRNGNGGHKKRHGRKEGGHKNSHGRNGGHKKGNEQKKNQAKPLSKLLKKHALHLLQIRKPFTSQIDTKTDKEAQAP